MIKIKYCGITTEAGVNAAIEAKVFAVGFVFVKGSRRHINAQAAIPLIELAKSAGLLTVALFANQDQNEVSSILKAVNPDVVQFHGHETAEFCEQFAYPYWKAIPMLEISDYVTYMMNHDKAEAFLLDAYGKRQTGGSGKKFDWFKFPDHWKDKMILAGGINQENVIQAIAATDAEFIDTSSGIESSPGVKSKDKMLELAKIVNHLNKKYKNP